MIDAIASCTESNCQTAATATTTIGLDDSNDDEDSTTTTTTSSAARQTNARDYSSPPSSPPSSTTATKSRSNGRKRNNTNHNRPGFNIQQPAYLSRAPTILSSPSSFLLTNGPANGSLFSSSSRLVNFDGGGGGQFALTPDARACVTATYLCVLIVNNTWLDCNLLEMLCNNNTNSGGDSSSSSSDRKTSSVRRQQADSIILDAQNATRWLANAKRDDLGPEKALESALSGLIAFAGGGGERGSSGHNTSPMREEDEGGGSIENNLFSTRLFIGGHLNNSNNSNELPTMNLLHLEPNRTISRPQKPPDIDRGGNGSEEEEDDGGGDANVSSLSEHEQWQHRPQQAAATIVLNDNRSPQFNKIGRLVVDDEERERILEQYFKYRKHKLSNNNNNNNNNHEQQQQQQQQSENFPSDKINNQLDGRAVFQQQQQPQPSATALPLTSTTPTSSLSSSSPSEEATTNLPPQSSSSFVSWIGRPFRGWSSYSFWPISLIATNQVADYPASSNYAQQQQQLVEAIQQQQQQTLQLLRPIDRSEQYNDIATNQSINQFKQTNAYEDRLQHDSSFDSISDENKQQQLSVTTDSFLASESTYQTPNTFSGSIVTAPTATGNHQLLGVYDPNNQQRVQQQHRNQQQIINPFDDQRQQQQQPHLACDCNEPSSTTTSAAVATSTATTSSLVQQLLETNINECRMYCASVVMKQHKQQQQLMDVGNNNNNQQLQQSSTGISNGGFTTPTTMATAATTSTTMSSSATTISPSAKMNPLDVTFLLYTRYHRDLVRELAQFSNGGGVNVGGADGGGIGSGGADGLVMASSSNNANINANSNNNNQNNLPMSSGGADNMIVSGDPIDLSNETSLNESRLNSSLPIKIVIHGFGSGGRRPWVSDMVYKLLDYEDVNVIVVDWEKGATLPNYVQAAGNTRLVGHKIALLIQSISLKYGLTGNSFHLIGFSLGAHVAGFAGMEIRNMTSVPRHWINRITGLDPASPLFEGYEANDRLDPSDAQFVDVIHSNGDGVLRGGFGSLQPMGHVDFYPNGGRVQVGCNSVILSALSDIIYGKWQSLCNHRRALNFFMDSFEFNKCRFRSFNCDSYESYLKGDCFDCGVNNEKCSYMGYLANYSRGRGKMYLTTHEEAPFCANQLIIKIIGSKGFKTHWGKVEVTLVTVDGKNESFLLSSLNGQTSGGHELANGHGKDSSQHNMQSLIVAHPTLVNFTHVLLRYTKYKGWIYSGDESWPIDKVFLMDSDGQVKSFCGFNTILESHITTRLNLEPGNCTIIEPNGNNNHNNIGIMNPNVVPITPNQQMGRAAPVGGGSGGSSAQSAVGGGGGGPQTQLPQQQQSTASDEQQQQQQHLHHQQHLANQQSVSTLASTLLNDDNNEQHVSSRVASDQSQQQQQQKAQSSSRNPRLFALIIQSNGGAGGAADSNQPPPNTLAHLTHGHSAPFQRMASGGNQQQQQQQSPMHQIMAF